MPFGLLNIWHLLVCLYPHIFKESLLKNIIVHKIIWSYEICPCNWKSFQHFFPQSVRITCQTLATYWTELLNKYQSLKTKACRNFCGGSESLDFSAPEKVEARSLRYSQGGNTWIFENIKELRVMRYRHRRTEASIDQPLPQWRMGQA